MDAATSQKVIENLLEQVDVAKGSAGVSAGVKATLDVLQKANTKLCLGIIGGSGFDDPDILQDRKESEVMTPFGAPSGPVVTGQIGGVDCVLIARHGPRHRIMPTNVPFQANVYAMKAAGCTHMVVCTACGSLREEMKPGDLVLLTSFIDRTTKRPSTFYDGSPNALPGVCHISMGEPFCEKTGKIIEDTMKELGIAHHNKGTMVSIEGPRFSTRAESHMFRAWGADVINMTTCPEAPLAAEAGMPYVAIAMVTDYDCWKEDEEAANVEAIMATMGKNKQSTVDCLLKAIPKFKDADWKPVVEAAQAKANSSVMLF